MVLHKTALPVRRFLALCAIAVFCALARPGRASAQPTDLHQCLSGASPTCYDVKGALVISFCSPDSVRSFQYYYGRVAWYPLRCVGPITVAVETSSLPDTRFPLYVEVVPLPEPSAFPLVCENLAGNVILIVYGHFGAPCGEWDEVGPVDITSVVPLGSLYAIRVHFFGNPTGYSPAMDCVRVTAQPADSAVRSGTWTRVKSLFR